MDKLIKVAFSVIILFVLIVSLAIASDFEPVDSHGAAAQFAALEGI